MKIFLRLFITLLMINVLSIKVVRQNLNERTTTELYKSKDLIIIQLT